MSAKQPAMSPSDLPVSEVLDRVTGPRRAEADELLAMLGGISGEPAVRSTLRELLERAHADTRSQVS